MKEFLLIFRADWDGMTATTPEEAQAKTQQWMDWVGNIASQNQLVDRGNRLFTHGKVVKANGMITDGPYSEIKESIGGYSIVRAKSYEEAIRLVSECPVLKSNGNVEVREINAL